MTRDDFVTIFNNAVNLFKQQAPKKTGHLSLNAVKGRWINNNHFRIWIDRDVLVNQPNMYEKIAGYYYAKTINDNQNYRTYGYVEKIARNIAQYIANQIGGVVK